MKTLGILMGTKTSFISNEYYNNNFKKFKYLDDLDPKLFKYKDDIPYDYAIYCEIKSVVKNKMNVIPLFGPKLTLKSTNQCDYIFCIYEGAFSFMDNEIKGFKNYVSIMKRTTAKVFPSIEFQLFIINKNKYMKYLLQKGYDLIPTKFININNDKTKNIKSINTFIDKGEYDQIIMKPELAGFASGFKHFKTISDVQISKYLDKIKKLSYQKLLVQPYIDEFLKYWEIKTIWNNGKFIYAYGTKVGLDFDDALPISHGGVLDDKLIKLCRKIGENIIKDIEKDFGNQILLRIDFGCCIDNDDICRQYFVNEIECCPTMSDDETIKNNFKLLANAILKSIK